MADPANDEQGIDAFVRAGEYALGLLEDAERAAARRELLAGGDFAEAVIWWDGQFALLAEDGRESDPSPAVWDAIQNRIDGDPGREPLPLHGRATGLSGWRLGAAMVATAVAAAVVTLIVAPLGSGPTVEQVPVPIASDQLFVQARGETDDTILAARIDPSRQLISLEIDGIEAPADEAPELWVIPEGGEPISLGLISGGGRFDRKLSSREADLLSAGATLAVTIEARASAPHQAPTPPIVVAGALSQL